MNPILYLESRKYKNSKLMYNLRSLGGYCVPNYFYRANLDYKLSLIENYDETDITGMSS